MRWSECYICGAEEASKPTVNDISVEIFECSECGEEYCNKCGDNKTPYQCNKCKEKSKKII